MIDVFVGYTTTKGTDGEILWIDIKCGKYLVAIGCGLWNMDERERERRCMCCDKKSIIISTQMDLS